jgi:hypothetical protein
MIAKQHGVKVAKVTRNHAHNQALFSRSIRIEIVQIFGWGNIQNWGEKPVLPAFCFGAWPSITESL